jgi:mannose-6-phosphate isomerase-like protein (cupin superfamily)
MNRVKPRGVGRGRSWFLRKLEDFLSSPIYERVVSNQVMGCRSEVLVLGIALCFAGVAAVSIDAWAVGPESQQAAQAIEKALQKHGGDVHACFAKVLADRLDSAGKVEVAVEVGKGGRIKSAKVQKLDKSAGPVLASCIEKAAQTWTIDGIEPGSTVVLPFAFKAQGSQFVVSAADIPERALGAPAPGKAKAGPGRAAPFTVKVLADEQNVKAVGIALTLLNLGPASRVAMVRHAHSGKILYLVKGHARLLGPEGATPLKMEEGAAVFVPAGYPHVIENMGRQSTAVFLQAFSPPGPERVYRDPTDARGRAEFEVIRDPASAKPTVSQIVAATAAEAKPVALPKRAGESKPLVTGGGMSLALLELVDAGELQSTGTSPGTELLYFISGGGNIKVGGEASSLTAETLVHVPRGMPYVLKVAAADKNEKVLVAQFWAGGPRSGTAPVPQREPRR